MLNALIRGSSGLALDKKLATSREELAEDLQP